MTGPISLVLSKSPCQASKHPLRTTNTTRTKMISRIAAKAPVSLLLLMLLLAMSYLVDAQYGHQQSYNYGGGGGYGGHGGSDYDAMEDRPKVNLGIRLRIPAFKFELPRFSLPKITVSAKIRQPEGPRVIQLPEINLDTSSKSELPNNKMHGGGGGGGGAYDNQYQGPAYGMAAGSYGGGNQHYGGQEKASVFSFSTEEEQPAYKPQYKPIGTTYQTMGSKTSYQPYMHQQQQQQSYSSSEVKPSYSMYSKPPGADQAYHYQQESAKNPDIGFNSPAYVGARQANAARRARA